MDKPVKLNPRDIIKANGTNRMDIFVRWMYVEAVLNNHSEEQIKSFGDLYCKMQDERLTGREIDMGIFIRGYIPHSEIALIRNLIPNLSDKEAIQTIISKGGWLRHFNELIKSIKKDGYKEDSIIWCSKLETGHKLSSGAHRLACCLAFNFDTIPVEFSSIEKGTALSPDDYSLEWFKEHKFSQEEITLIENFYNSKSE